MKTKKIVYDMWWEAVVEIADNAEPFMREQLLFWSDGQSLIDDADGDVETAFLKFLGESLLYESMDNSLYGILKEWEKREGWYPLDGSYGVKLTHIDEWEFNRNDFQIRQP